MFKGFIEHYRTGFNCETWRFYGVGHQTWWGKIDSQRGLQLQ